MLKLKAGELVRHLTRDGDRHNKERIVRVERTDTDSLVKLIRYGGGKIYKRISGLIEKNKMTTPLLLWLVPAKTEEYGR